MFAVLFSDCPEWPGVSTTSRHRGKQNSSVHGNLRGTHASFQPPEKPNACANEPKPPRATPPEVEPDDVPDDEWLDEESPLKKLLREDDPPPPEPPDEDPRGGHPAFVCGIAGAAIPGEDGRQFSPGISA